jgi:glycerophosphoryl diester phosphodiesterase
MGMQRKSWNDLPRPTIYAHRGASAYAPENTLAAFTAAVSQGADAIELDAKLTADGKVVVFHDQTLTRTTGVHGRLADMKLEELRRLDAGSHFDIAYRAEPIPTLDEVLTVVGNQIFINIELTNYAAPTDNLPKKVAELVRQYHLENTVLFSSFNPWALIQVRRLLPQAPIALLCSPGASGWWARSWFGSLLGYNALHPEFEDVNPLLVDRCHQANKRVNVYTVNQASDLKRMFALGVDGVFTDDPLLARKLLKQGVSQRQSSHYGFGN